jgi:catalase
VLSADDREHLISNLAGALGDGVDHAVQVRAVERWQRVEAELGSRLAAKLGLASPTGATPAGAPATA